MSAPSVAERPAVLAKADEALMLGAAALMASPVAARAAEVAQVAEVTPSLKNLLGSVVAGDVIFGALFGAVYVVSSFDKLDARR